MLAESAKALRAVLSGLLIGLLINVSNIYYGLRVGTGSKMFMVSALLGYAGFKLCSGHTVKQIAAYICGKLLLVSVTTATVCMPLTAGVIAAIPAREYIMGPDENGSLHISFGSLVFLVNRPLFLWGHLQFFASGTFRRTRAIAVARTQCHCPCHQHPSRDKAKNAARLRYRTEF